MNCPEHARVRTTHPEPASQFIDEIFVVGFFISGPYPSFDFVRAE
jgi:hypothetical protein